MGTQNRRWGLTSGLLDRETDAEVGVLKMFLGKDGVLTSWAEGDTLEFLLHIEGVDTGLTSISLQIMSMLRQFPPLLQLSYPIRAPRSEECGALGTSKSFQ